ncbi:MAG: hypothetical protein JNJ97_03995 [Alphaproteobacteria bacterium]|nr:hypothetical protein [Alphaproteobacteria bacterium]MCA0451923.1 hypothetical protein [Pseudomonadota bacterium]
MRAPPILAAILFAAVLPASATDMTRTRDGHMTRPFDSGVRPNIEAQRIPEQARPRTVLLRSPKPLAELGTYDARASAECRKRDFGQFEQHRATVVLAGQTYGAAQAGSNDLADYRNVERPGTLYVFEHQSMTNCRVWRVRAR